VKNALLWALFSCCVLQSGAQESAPARANRASAANGEKVFMHVGCYTCHGTVGHGGAGPRLAPNTLPLAAFEIWVRNGTPGWSIASGMPAFPRTVLSDGELADVREFLASLPPPPALADVPLLK
jgi:ubiquinol-cytochrome c reductase cytochrome c subunit